MDPQKIGEIRHRWSRKASKVRINQESVAKRTIPPQNPNVTTSVDTQDVAPEQKDINVGQPALSVTGTGSGPTFYNKSATAPLTDEQRSYINEIERQVGMSSGERFGEFFKNHPFMGPARSALNTHQWALNQNPVITGALFGLGAAGLGYAGLVGRRYAAGLPIDWGSRRKLLTAGGIGLGGGLLGYGMSRARHNAGYS